MCCGNTKNKVCILPPLLIRKIQFYLTLEMVACPVLPKIYILNYLNLITNTLNLNIIVDYKEEYNATLPLFIPYEDGTYNVIQKKVTWYEALNMCSQSGGYLASVHDQNGQLFLEDIVKRDGFPLWVGLSSHDVSLVLFSRNFPNVLEGWKFEHKILIQSVTSE